MSASVGFVILSHRSGGFLPRLIAALDGEYDRPPIVIHHDFGQAELDTSLFGDNVQIVRPHVRTAWGHISLVKAVLRSIELLYRDGGPDWFFLLSAQDYPIMPGERVRSELAKADVDAFVDIWPMEQATKAAATLVGDGNAGMRHFGLEGYRKMRWKLQFRQQLWLPIMRFRPRLRIGRLTWRPPIKARHPFHQGFKSFYGDLWFCANRKAARILVDPSPDLLALQRYSARRFLPEEGYFAIALGNSPGLKLCRDNHRFVKWQGEDHPKELDEGDADEMLASGNFFARKFQDGAPVLDVIDARLDNGRLQL